MRTRTEEEGVCTGQVPMAQSLYRSDKTKIRRKSLAKNYFLRIFSSWKGLYICTG
jgi:hypothetical protein